MTSKRYFLLVLSPNYQLYHPIQEENYEISFAVIGQKTYKRFDDCYYVEYLLVGKFELVKVEDLENKELLSLQSLALRVQLAAAAIASSFLLIFVPNIETITFTVFFVGFLFPLRYALSITLTTVIGWELLASMVFAFSGLTFAFKLLAWTAITILGSMARKGHITKPYEFAIFGAISALIYDITVTIPYALFFVEEKTGFLSVFLASLIFGIYFTIFHTVGNTLLFAFIPKLIDTLYPILESRYSYLIKIDKTYFLVETRRVFSVLLIGLLISSLFTAAIISYKEDTQPDDESEFVFVDLNFDYADLKPFEHNHLNVSTQESVFEIMLKVADISYTTQYGDLPFIEEINGIRNNVDIINHNWIFYINGAKANRGASQMYVHEADIILWKYE
ncbi:MAG: DUF4430 domain-containing protein [Candidatus Kariarchaeaceae archaeon]|jgi:hypothetical protein